MTQQLSLDVSDLNQYLGYEIDSLLSILSLSPAQRRFSALIFSYLCAYTTWQPVESSERKKKSISKYFSYLFFFGLVEHNKSTIDFVCCDLLVYIHVYVISSS